jgi:DNA-binding protein Fis
VLNYTGGNKTKAAAILGIDRKTLRRKIEGVEEE